MGRVHGQASGTLRATTTAGTATTNTVCADCADGTFAAGMWAKCALVTSCGNLLTCGARVEVLAATTTADRTCTACADGSYATANGDCGKCTPISGASAVTCTSNADSIATTCVAQCPKKLHQQLLPVLVHRLAQLVTGTIPTHVTRVLQLPMPVV